MIEFFFYTQLNLKNLELGHSHVIHYLFPVMGKYTKEN